MLRIEQIVILLCSVNRRHCCQTVPRNEVPHITTGLSDIDTQCGGPRPRPSLIALSFGS
jgi:hypothetical protein